MSAPFARLAAAAAVAALVPLALAGCAKDEAKPAAGSTSSGGSAAAAPVKLIKDGTLKVCTHSGFKPFEFPEGGKVVGYDIDIADLVAKKVNATTEVVDIDFGQITTGAAFAAGKCDMAAAGMTINDKRKAALGISDPYFTSKQALLVKKSSAVKDLGGLKGKILGVQTDTTGKEYAEKNVSQYGYTMKVFEDAFSLANAVKAGTVEGSLNDSGVMLNFAKDNADTSVVQQIDTQEQYGLATGKDNTAMLTTMNQVLKDAKADGTLDKIEVKWFGAKLS
ncbi:MAG: transporter substrate-binding domain-containing protein [Austwickia sp.]|nr:transporter substrate-binding domain-containing protein [Austwickia sp.]